MLFLMTATLKIFGCTSLSLCCTFPLKVVGPHAGSVLSSVLDQRDRGSWVHVMFSVAFLSLFKCVLTSVDLMCYTNKRVLRTTARCVHLSIKLMCHGSAARWLWTLIITLCCQTQFPVLKRTKIVWWRPRATHNQTTQNATVSSASHVGSP